MTYQRGIGPTLRALLILTGVLVVLAGLAGYAIVRRGLSTHAEPSGIEETIARAMRHWATPTAVRNRSNPLAPSADVLEEALHHYADHCGNCHGSDGRGDTEIGRGLYPRAPDMRASDTQSLTDGELFSIIEHGIRLTGMPGWGNGTPEGERQSWGLVHFVRRLPAMTPEDVERVDALSPRTAQQWQELEETRRFLAGEP